MYDYETYMKSQEWRNKREIRQKLDRYKCRQCGSIENLNVHHKTYDRLGNERMEDLITLCQSCHKKEHDKINKAKALAEMIKQIIRKTHHNVRELIAKEYSENAYQEFGLRPNHLQEAYKIREMVNEYLKPFLEKSSYTQFITNMDYELYSITSGTDYYMTKRQSTIDEMNRCNCKITDIAKIVGEKPENIRKYIRKPYKKLEVKLWTEHST